MGKTHLRQCRISKLSGWTPGPPVYRGGERRERRGEEGRGRIGWDGKRSPFFPSVCSDKNS